MQMSLITWSWFFLIIYTGGMIAIGVVGQRRVKHADDFATARGAYGPVFLAFAFAATIASGATFLGTPGLGYEWGTSTLWGNFLYPNHSWWSVVAILLSHIPLGLLPHIGNKLWALQDVGQQRTFIKLAFTFGLTLGMLGLAGLLGTALIRDWLGAAEFERIETGIAASIRSSVSGKAVLDDPVLSRHGTSQLSLLTDEEYEQGMQRIRSALAFAVQPPSVFQIDLRLFGTTAVKPKGSR